MGVKALYSSWSLPWRCQHQPGGQTSGDTCRAREGQAGRVWWGWGMVSSRTPGGAWGWAGSHLEPLLASKLTPLSSGWFAVYEVSPTPPITVTHKPEEDTFGVSHFLVKRRSFSDFI